MRQFFILLVFLAFIISPVAAQQEAPQTSLNHYIEFLSQSSEQVIRRFKMLQTYQDDVSRYRKKADYGLRLPSSGPLEEYYYKKALPGLGIEAGKRKQLNAGLENVWNVLNKLDETCKSLETYVRLKDYERNNLKKSDALVTEMQSLFERYAHDKNALYTQIRQVYAGVQNRPATDPYIVTEKAMGEVIAAQQRLLDALPYYLNAETKAEWPTALVRQSMLDDEKALATIGNTASQLQYPASDMVGTFKSALASMQDIKRRALDDHNFAAQQSAEHGNAVYLSLVEQFNHDMLEFYKAFVGYSKPGHLLLNYPFFSPVMRVADASDVAAASKGTPPFQDKSFQPLNVKKAAAPASAAVIKTLNQYVDWINQSLRQMHLLQMIVRNYQSSAEYYRDPAKAQKRANLSYSHEDFKLPSSEYTLLLNASTAIPEPYRKSVTGQAEVLMNILKEMDGLSIELIRYTSEKQYLQDQLKRSDAILDRYLVLFDILDQKKELLYNDIRRIHESYPNATPTSSWYIAGNAMLRTMDNGHDVMFGMRDYLKGETSKLPETANLEADSRQLIADEYKNMKGLQRYGRNNGLCPYTPYEDLGANAGRFAEKVQQYKPATSGYAAHPYESFYYFYNNELVYEYNNFIELSKAGLLKTINQPDVFAFRRTSPQKPAAPPAKVDEPKVEKPVEKPRENRVEDIAQVKTNNAEVPATQQPPAREDVRPLTNEAEPVAQVTRDTVYVERLRVDTVYVDRNAQLQNVTRSLDGFAPNNMVLLLDVSSSMNSPYKLPLLKRSIKSLLTLVRPEDMISIVLYSGKARVVLKPTSGAKASEISRMIDLLQSDGDTDGNEGIKLAYKTANKQYIRAGNNRIVLATDGEFPVSAEVMDMIRQNARQDVYLSVFTFGRNEHTGQKLKKLSELGMGSYAHVTDASADLQLILEAQAKKLAGR
ncbi:von Willebrand factor type A domain-containing protein [Dyadobacter soli]|uniref:von Willebrand factor type A domain-containing protein n=1 Tax=Dyadobacter soli TaxID=659014 RepID=A0A1G7NH47_9BACT|nr:VWA domain-containing protein [Dyadobacter soli]SDF73241.1 von Willebrand factor type A domain-containing protein [Dyadobacter soli]